MPASQVTSEVAKTLRLDRECGPWRVKGETAVATKKTCLQTFGICNIFQPSNCQDF